MLESLYIRNLVLVPELQLEFGPGLVTVTGETGAGKSLILGALRLLSGGRAGAALIRRGATTCEVCGSFLLTDKAHPAVGAWVDQHLEELSLPPREEGRLLLRRVLTESGSRAFVNGSPVTAAILKEFGDALVDIHGPNESHSLLQPARQLRLLDLYCGDAAELSAVQDAWKELSRLNKSREALLQEGLAPEEMELLAHQLKEIQSAGLTPDEEEGLLARHRLVENAANLQSIAGGLSQWLSQGEDCLVDQLAPWIRQAEELSRLDPGKGAEFLRRMDALSNEMNDLGAELGDYAQGLDFDGEALQEMNARLDRLQKLKRRYGPTLADVIATGERLAARLKRASGRTHELEELSRQLDECRKRHQECCGKLGALRRKGAAALSGAIVKKLQHLGFQKAHFQVQLTPCPSNGSGAESAEFLFAPNAGEPMAPLRQAASSGEVARVMLAIKTVLSQQDDIPVLLFDEIDANIGGRTAFVVGQELHSLGEKHQVFSITHLPVVAAAADRQYLVEKHEEANRTIAGMHQLTPDERRTELVRMLGAEPGDAAALAHARELLQNARAPEAQPHSPNPSNHPPCSCDPSHNSF